jgi:hypothetical protein
MDYGGHDSKYESNLIITFPSKWRQMCIDFGTFGESHGHVVLNNTCMVPRSDEPILFLDQCRESHTTLARNRYLTPDGNASAVCGYGSDPIPFASFQDSFALEQGSVVVRNPSDALVVVVWAMLVLASD